MNALAARLERCKQYREEALQHPQKNKLYIEDLNLSIVMFKKAVKNNSSIYGKGWNSEETDPAS
jgi:hypothetical protein